MPINKKTIQALIAQGKIEKAVEQLLQLAEQYDEDLYNLTIQQSARLNGLRQQVMGGVLSESQADLTRNKITYAVNQCLDDVRVEWEIPDGDASGAPPSLSPPKPNLVKILFLAADPSNMSRLRLGQEHREIQEKLQLSRDRDRFALTERMSVRPADVSQAMLDEKPVIVHFSGHGASSGELVFEDAAGLTRPVSPAALSGLFELTESVQCVVLNACYSEPQAVEIAKHVDYVIGMSDAIGDKAAIAFAIGFYQAIGAGETFERAYKYGCTQILLQGIPENLTPKLLVKQ
jgi:hypothetical protein